jgi:hypothetical protein
MKKMQNKSIEKRTILKGKKMEKKIDCGSDMTWINFPYNKFNLKMIRNSMKELGLCNENVHISYDENDIFIRKDNFLVPK